MPTWSQLGAVGQRWEQHSTILQPRCTQLHVDNSWINDQSLPTAIQLTAYMLTEKGECYTIKLQTKHAKAKLSWAIHSSMPRHEGSQADSIPGTTVEVCPGCPGCADPCSTPSASH